MELVLDTYTEEHTEDEPLICMDEAAKQMTEDTEPTVPMEPGGSAK